MPGPRPHRGAVCCRARQPHAPLHAREWRHAARDGHKRVRGSKLHLAVDTLGHLLALHVTPANTNDRDAVSTLAEAVQDATGESVDLAYVDQGYTGERPSQTAAAHGITLEVVRLPEAKRGFVPLPRRWVVERSAAPACSRRSFSSWLELRVGTLNDYVFPSRPRTGQHLSTRHYASLVGEWVEAIGLGRSAYGTHSPRRTKVALIHKRTGNLQAVQILLGQTKLESTVRYLGVDAEDVLTLSEATEI
ncbi:transposase [Roseomonas harenae]|uniref:transposase n=1 Tax=Muricoccus harenae TaxID=2692566 RepID=UPI0038B5ADEB